MLIEQLKVNNKSGFHARPASLIAEEAMRFESEIQIVFGKKRACAKSPVSILSLGINYGDKILLSVTGKDEKEAMLALNEVLQRLD